MKKWLSLLIMLVSLPLNGTWFINFLDEPVQFKVTTVSSTPTPLCLNTMEFIRKIGEDVQLSNHSTIISDNYYELTPGSALFLNCPLCEYLICLKGGYKHLGREGWKILFPTVRLLYKSQIIEFVKSYDRIIIREA